jgi:nucleoside triphosphate pyrophosphatase
MTEAPPAVRLILASASPHRRKLLQATGLIFDVEPAPIDEAAIKGALLATGGDANSIAGGLAAAKAHAVSSRHRDAMVIGADQVLDCEGRLFDKPGSLANARDQLRRLRGRTHQLHSGVALAHNDGIVWQCTDTATLVMRQFSDAFLERYLVEAGDAIWGNVGAYAIEGIGIQLFASVRGDASTIIGLPMLPLLSELRARGMLRT